MAVENEGYFTDRYKAMLYSMHTVTRAAEMSIAEDFAPHFAAWKEARKGSLTARAWRGKDQNERQRKIRAYGKAVIAYEKILKEFEARADAEGLEMWFEGHGSQERVYFLKRTR